MRTRGAAVRQYDDLAEAILDLGKKLGRDGFGRFFGQVAPNLG